MMAKPVDVLRAARAIIAEREHWTTGEMARNAEGNSCPWGSRDAVRFCALGAIRRVVRDPGDVIDACAVLHAAARALYPEKASFVTEVNDQLGHEAVLAMFDRAIAAWGEAEAKRCD